MNKKQKTVLWVGVIVFVLMGLFPPWVLQSNITSLLTLSLSERNWLAEQKHPMYKFLLKPPKLKYQLAQYSIDVKKLGVQWAIVAVITGGLIVTLADKKRSGEGQSSY